MPYHHVFLFVVTAAMTTGKCQILARLWSNRTLIHWWWDSGLIHSKMLGSICSGWTYAQYHRTQQLDFYIYAQKKRRCAFTERHGREVHSSIHSTAEWMTLQHIRAMKGYRAIKWFYFIKYKTIQKYSVLLELRRVVTGLGGEVVNRREHGGSWSAHNDASWSGFWLHGILWF